MSLAEAPNGDEPRRGTRVRKQVQPYDPTEDKTEKKRAARDEDDSDLTDIESSGDEAPAPTGKRKANGTRKPPAKRKKAAPKNGHAADVVPEGVDGFKTDSPLFNALLQPNIALEPLLVEWVDAYERSAGEEDAEKAAVQELVQFFIRACGLNADIDIHEALDPDGVADVIERIQDESVKTNSASYPLISRTKGLRQFKNSLTAVIANLIETLSLTPCIYDDVDTTKHSFPLMPLLSTWLNTMSSSPLRCIRHTGTFIALKVNSAICQVASLKSNELSVKQRQKEAEAKKASAPAAKKRLKEAEDKVKEAHSRKTRLEEYMVETDTVVFVHRVRDTDPAIRTDCIRELGVWAKRYPEMYMKNTFHSHFFRSTNDNDGPVRLETMKALMNIFGTPSAASNAGSFTLRIAPRLIQIASQDTEIAVRTNAIAVISQIDKTGALEDYDEEKRSQVARLIFDVEPKVRKAAATFVKGLWEERAENLTTNFESQRDGKKKRASKIKQTDLQRHFKWKALAELLVETSQGLERPEHDEAGPSNQLDLVTSAGNDSPTTRADAAAGALYSQIDLLQDWYALVDYLLLDHSTSETDPWLLTEEEEDFMIEVLITCIRREETDEEDDQKTKELMKVLPRLFTKHQTEVRRIVGILSITEYMDLSLYLDMRKTAAYEALWDDVTKQFLQHTEPVVLSAAIRAINTLTSNSSMEATNKQKLAELEESLFASLRDAIDGEDVPGMTISEDQLSSIEAILLRVGLLASNRDIVTAMQDEEGGQSSGWTIVLAFAGRGALGFKEETKIVEHALHIAMVHIGWLVQRFTDADAENAEKVATLKARRDEALEIFESYSVRGPTNASESVKRQAFLAFINLHTLFCRRREKTPPGAEAAPLEMAADKQHKLGGVFQAAAERYASDLEDNAREEDEDDDMTRIEKQRAVRFFQVVAAFVAALRIGVIDVDQAKEPLAHYGRFGPTYDAIVKKLVDVLRDEGIYNKEATTVAHVIREALQNSFQQFLDEDTETEPEAPIALARLAASAFIVHGPQFTVLKQIHPEDVYDLHVGAIDWFLGKVGTLVKQHAAARDKEARTRIAAKRAKVLTYLKPLSILLGPVTGRDALRIRNHLEEKINASGAIQGMRSSPSYKAYEKRLVGIAGKDAELKFKPRKPDSRKSNKSAEIVEDSDNDDTPEPEKTPEPVEPVESIVADNVSENQDDTPPPPSRSQKSTTSSQDHPNSQKANLARQETNHEASQETNHEASLEMETNHQASQVTNHEASQENNSQDDRPSTNGGTKRPLAEDDGDSLPDLNDVSMFPVDDLDLDEAFPARHRSVSVEPGAKRAKPNRGRNF